MQKASYSVGLSFFFALVAWSCQMGPARAQDESPRAVASIVLPDGHRVDFFAPPGGPIAIAEIGPKGSPRVVTDALARKKPSEIYKILKGPGAVPPKELVEAEEQRVPIGAPNRPDRNKGAAGRGPDDTDDQQWFKATFCKAFWECTQGWSWANTSWGHHQGRGYAANGMNGSEARAPRTLKTDWWKGSSWATLNTVSMPPGWWAWTTGGNVGNAFTCHDRTWYFKSEIQDNHTGDTATVSLAAHMYAPGSPGEPRQKRSCSDCPGGCACPSCLSCSSRSAGGVWYCSTPTTCPNRFNLYRGEEGDSCVNPP